MRKAKTPYAVWIIEISTAQNLPASTNYKGNSMFAPSSDDNPTRNVPDVTITLLVIMAGIFIYQSFYGDAKSLIANWGFNPHLLIDHFSQHNAATLVTAIFLHGSIMHLVGNALFLYIFGDNVEDEMRRIHFLIFFIAAGVFANLVQGYFTHWQSETIIGASGAISALLGAYIVLFPDAKVNTVFSPAQGIYLRLKVPALLYLIAWFGMQGLYLFISHKHLFPGLVSPHIAYLAHIGGFVFGCACGLCFSPFRRPTDEAIAAKAAKTKWKRVR